MESPENVDAVRRGYELWNSRDFSSLPEIANPELVIDLSRNVFNPHVYRGYDGFRHLVEAIEEMWEDFEMTPEEFIDAGDRVVTAVRLSGRGRGSGADADMRLFNIWEFRDGKLVRLTGGYRTRDEALEDAGLGG